jgi:uncharacterized repeat protein (TIGR03803 family)
MKRSRRSSAFVLVFLLASAPLAAQYTTLHAFSGEAGEPHAPLFRSADGRLYGTTSKGCRHGVGSVYALIPNGFGGYIHHDVGCFAILDGGHTPLGGVIEGADGALYGTASRGGPDDAGAVFRMTKSGQLSFLHVFTGADGREPHGELRLATDGAFYGTTAFGGSTDQGTVFRLETNGDFTSLHSFDGDDGMQPMAGLLEGADGALYGTTYLTNQGGFGGTVYRITTAGALTTLHEFVYPYFYPKAPLIQLADGKLYGTTSWYPATAFRISTDGSNFEPLSNIAASDAGLEEGSDGYLYGTGEGFVFRLSPVNFNYQVIHQLPGFEGRPSALIEIDGSGFMGTCAGSGNYGGFVFLVYPSGQYQTVDEFPIAPPGKRPTGGIVEGADGGIYGTTQEGGYRFGTIFRVGPRGGHWLVRPLGVFDGELPEMGLTLGSDGAFYGTTRFGGSGGWGKAFRVDASGMFSTIHEFTQSDGSPSTPFGRTADGGFLGATWQGDPWGSLYRLGEDGTFEILHTFQGSSLVFGRPIEASDGAVIGTSSDGGTGNAGTTFRWDSLNGYLDLYSFTASFEDGYRPDSGLIEVGSGDFFGATSSGGPSDLGGVFHMDFAGAVTFIHEFADGEGGHVDSELLDGPDGRLYGVAFDNGANGLGTIFRADPDGTFEKLHDFSQGEGGKPAGPLLRGTDGALYGSLSEGGEYGGGAIFRFTVADLLSVGSLAPDSGPAAGGTALVVTGTSFDPGATLSIGGSPIAASVDDAQHISTTSPAAAPGSVGVVAVSNPGGESRQLLSGWFADFLDVPSAHVFHDYVEDVVRAGITAGCGNGNYCVNAPVTRAQMAVFLLKAEHGPAYVPPNCVGVFADVACPGPFTDWIEQLAAEGVTTGCGGADYCPASPVTRAQMAVFLLKTLLGTAYVPAPAAGIFGDVPVGSFAADWIEDLYGRGITGGCSASPLLYCPNNPNNRGQMAVFLVKTFGL